MVRLKLIRVDKRGLWSQHLLCFFVKFLKGPDTQIVNDFNTRIGYSFFPFHFANLLSDMKNVLLADICWSSGGDASYNLSP